MRENQFTQFVKLAFSKLGLTMFRNNVGLAYASNKTRKNPDGSITLYNYRPIKYGLAPGSHDFIGFKKIKITQEMVGSSIAIFIGVELKSSTGSASLDQKRFSDLLSKNGALSIHLKAPKQQMENGELHQWIFQQLSKNFTPSHDHTDTTLERSKPENS